VSCFRLLGSSPLTVGKALFPSLRVAESDMIDATTQQEVRVSTDGNAGPYIMVPAEQLEQVTVLLAQNEVRCWADEEAISVNGEPEIAVINLDRDCDPAKVQQLLDSVP